MHYSRRGCRGRNASLRELVLKSDLSSLGETTRRFQHISDVVVALDIMLHKGIIGETYNVGTTEETSVRDVAKAVARLIDLEAKSSKVTPVLAPRVGWLWVHG